MSDKAHLVVFSLFERGGLSHGQGLNERNNAVTIRNLVISVNSDSDSELDTMILDTNCLIINGWSLN